MGHNLPTSTVIRPRPSFNVSEARHVRLRRYGTLVSMYRIGLTGGIAAGKSVAADRFRELGAAVVDHDVLAREAVRPGSAGLAEIRKVFGAEVLLADGSLNRPALGRIVFGDEDALERLNAIVHPAVYELSAAAERAAEADFASRDDAKAVIVHDIPLLVETGQQDDFDLLLVVDAPASVRVERLVQSRGMEREDAQARVASQLGDEARRAAADVILDGAGSVEKLRRQVDQVWQALP